MLQRTLNKTAYYTSLVISFLVFFAIWLNLIVLEVSNLRRPNAVAVSSIVGSGEKMPDGRVVSLKTLDKFSKHNLPFWAYTQTDEGKVWTAIVYFKAIDEKKGVQLATFLKSQPIYGVIDGKWQFFPVVIKDIQGKKNLEFDMPSGPITVDTSEGPIQINKQKSILLKTLIAQRENREYFRKMLRMNPIKETIDGSFIDAYSHSAPHTPCVLPLCYVYKPSSYKDFYSFSIEGHTLDLVLTFDGDGSFQSSDYKKELQK